MSILWIDNLKIPQYSQSVNRSHADDRSCERISGAVFDNEITAGSGDLRSSFFWLMAFLAPIGILIPVSGLILFHGSTDLLRVISLPDKVLYLGISIVAIGRVAVLTWSGLVVDRRDALVLGTLPVALTVIVRAKLAALAAYIGLIVLGMHAGASLSFGFILGHTNPLWFVGLGIAAHFIASSFASAFIFFTVTATQSVLLATLGPRAFARLSPVPIQTALTAFVVGTLLTLPSVSRAIVGAVSADDGAGSWVFAPVRPSGSLVSTNGSSGRGIR